MPIYTVQAPDGKTYDIEGPEGATADQLGAFIWSQGAAEAKQEAPASVPASNGTTAIGALGAGLGSGFGNVALAGQQYLGKGLQVLGADKAGQWLVDDATQGRNRLKSEIEPYEQDHPFAAGAGELGGNVVATLPVGGLLGKGVGLLGSAVPKAAGVAAPLSRALTSSGAGTGLGLGYRVLGGAATGAASGALLSPDDPGGGALLGGVVGGAFPLVQTGISRAISPRASTDPGIQLLRGAGVRPTVGQTMGGAANALEEKLMSVPVLGDSIGAARARANEQFNAAALNRALGPIGEATTKIGREGIDDVASKLGQAYDKLIPQLNFKADAQFAGDLQKLQGMAATGLEPAQAQRFERILRDKVVGKLSQAGGMTGQTYKAVEADIGLLAKEYGGSATAGDRLLGGALKELQDALRGTLARSNPQQAAQLKAINVGYANYARLRQAAGYVGANEGVFTPNQLMSSVRAADKSVGKGAFARGDALMQDLAEAGKSVLGNKVPNSGTADRLLPTAGLAMSGALNPLIPAGVFGSSVLYTQPAQNLMTGLLAARPQAAKAVAKGFDKGASILVPGAVPLGFYAGSQR